MSSVCSLSQSSRGSAYSPLVVVGAVLATMMFAPRCLLFFFRLFYCGVGSDAAQDNHGRRRRQCLARDPEGGLAAPVDVELLANLLHERVERGREAMHRQHHGGAQSPGDVGYAVERHG